MVCSLVFINYDTIVYDMDKNFKSFRELLQQHYTVELVDVSNFFQNLMYVKCNLVI